MSTYSRVRLHQIIDDGIALTGIEQNKRVRRAGGNQQPNRRQNFVVVAAGDDGADVLMRVAELIDAADHFQIEGIFVNFPCARRQNHADGARRGRGNSFHRIAQLFGRTAHALLGFLADGGIISAGSGHGRWRHACQRRHIPNGYGHKNRSFVQKDGAKAAHAPPAFASALIVKEDARNVNHAGAIYARNLRKFAQDDEWNRSLFSPSQRRIRKMSISQLSLL